MKNRIKNIIGAVILVCVIFVAGFAAQAIFMLPKMNEKVSSYDIQRFETFRTDILNDVLKDRYNCLYLYDNDIIFLPSYIAYPSKDWSTAVLMRGEFPSKNIKECSELKAFLVLIDYSTGKYKVIFL